MATVPLTKESLTVGVTYLLTTRLFQRITNAKIPLTELVPTAMAHIHPLFTETVRVGQPAGDLVVAALDVRMERVKAALPGRAELFRKLHDTAVAISYQGGVLKVGKVDVDTANAAVYVSYSALCRFFHRLETIAVANDASTPTAFYDHLTSALTGPALQAELEALQAHFTTIDDFLVAGAV